MNWIKKILGLKTNKQCAIHIVSGSLSIEQLEKADMWYCLHKNHVNKLYHLAENSLPPTLNEDKNNPALWKEGHWKWYLDNYR
jgi:hypothetical protein